MTDRANCRSDVRLEPRVLTAKCEVGKFPERYDAFRLQTVKFIE
jgi:hypothetical protein